MSRVILCLLCLYLAFSGCKPDAANVNYALTDDQLAQLMFDVQLSDVAVSEATGTARDTLSELFWLRLTEIYKLSKPELMAEIRKLETDAEKMKIIMDKVQITSDSIH